MTVIYDCLNWVWSIEGKFGNHFFELIKRNCIRNCPLNSFVSGKGFSSDELQKSIAYFLSSFAIFEDQSVQRFAVYNERLPQYAGLIDKGKHNFSVKNKMLQNLHSRNRWTSNAISDLYGTSAWFQPYAT